ncbi:hypothetical protein K461DRAFT_307929 [Myriangium duriaei CBS 260.36]|uniref:Uncharacterized protein n=1 Tax=Myriangium duriaei CBS 260.36 TaxID=1168546 RepID=A0A9P4J100_9PEZI|nr:hypothetical protein K461DRAFT_307929 [Myriangium duriaei CBS 260.36]
MTSVKVIDHTRADSSESDYGLISAPTSSTRLANDAITQKNTSLVLEDEGDHKSSQNDEQGPVASTDNKLIRGSSGDPTDSIQVARTITRRVPPELKLEIYDQLIVGLMQSELKLNDTFPNGVTPRSRRAYDFRLEDEDIEIYPDSRIIYWPGHSTFLKRLIAFISPPPVFWISPYVAYQCRKHSWLFPFEIVRQFPPLRMLMDVDPQTKRWLETGLGELASVIFYVHLPMLCDVILLKTRYDPTTGCAVVLYHQAEVRPGRSDVPVSLYKDMKNRLVWRVQDSINSRGGYGIACPEIELISEVAGTFRRTVNAAIALVKDLKRSFRDLARRQKFKMDGRWQRMLS